MYAYMSYHSAWVSLCSRSWIH